jgi:tetratricopeptide (TPR) repeat protein
MEISILGAEESLVRTRQRAATVYLEIGTIHKSMNQPMEALGAFGKMQAANPGDIDATNQLGALYRELGRYLDSEKEFQKLVDMAEGSGDQALLAETLREMAQTHFMNGRAGVASGLIERSLEIEKVRDHQRGIAIASEQLGTVKAALGAHKRAKVLYETSGSLFQVLGDRDGARRMADAVSRLVNVQDEPVASSRTNHAH